LSRVSSNFSRYDLSCIPNCVCFLTLFFDIGLTCPFFEIVRYCSFIISGGSITIVVLFHNLAQPYFSAIDSSQSTYSHERISPSSCNRSNACSSLSLVLDGVRLLMGSPIAFNILLILYGWS